MSSRKAKNSQGQQLQRYSHIKTKQMSQFCRTLILAKGATASILISLALSVLTSMLDTSLQASEKEEERKGAVAAAAKVLPKLINVRPEEKERVLRHQKDFFPKTKDIFSEERNKEAKVDLNEILRKVAILGTLPRNGKM